MRSRFLLFSLLPFSFHLFGLFDHDFNLRGLNCIGHVRHLKFLFCGLLFDPLPDGLLACTHLFSIEIPHALQLPEGSR